MFKRVGGTVAVIVALVGSGFLFGQATADSQSTAAAAKPGSSQAVVKQLKKLNSKTASIDAGVAAIDAGVAAIGSNLENVNRGIASINTGIVSIDTSIAAMLQIARVCTIPTNNCFG